MQYFEDGYALHGAYWHDRFGVPKSHGCINLAPEDARRLFFFTEPEVPTRLARAALAVEGHGRLRARLRRSSTRPRCRRCLPYPRCRYYPAVPALPPVPAAPPGPAVSVIPAVPAIPAVPETTRCAGCARSTGCACVASAIVTSAIAADARARSGGTAAGSGRAAVRGETHLKSHLRRAVAALERGVDFAGVIHELDRNRVRRGLGRKDRWSQRTHVQRHAVARGDH